MTNEVMELVKKSAAVPSVPQVVVRFLEITQDPQFDYQQLVDLLSTDPGMTGAAGVRYSRLPPAIRVRGGARRLMRLKRRHRPAPTIGRLHHRTGHGSMAYSNDARLLDMPWTILVRNGRDGSAWNRATGIEKGHRHG